MRRLLSLGLLLLGCRGAGIEPGAARESLSILEVHGLLPRTPRSAPAGLAIALPRHADDGLSLALTDHPAFSLRIVPLGLAHVEASPEATRRIFARARPSTDVFHLVSDHAVEELRVVRTRAGAVSLEYVLETGAEVRDVQVHGGRVELLDAGGVARIWSDPAFAVDAHGTKRALLPALSTEHGARHVTFSLDDEGLAYPLAIDPAWAATSNMASPRQLHAAVRLADGRVLVTGGFGLGFAETKTAEIFNPSNNTWSPAASLQANTRDHSMVLLSSGKVLAVYDSSAELYAASTDTWTTAGAQSVSRRTGAVLDLGAKGVLVAGSNSFQIYTPGAGAGTWSTSVAVTTGSEIKAVLLTTGKVFIGGGTFGNIYDPATNAFTTTSSSASQRQWPTVFALPNGKALVAGGFKSGAPSSHSTSEIYDPATNTWSAGPTMTAPRYLARSVVLSDGRLLITGGDDDTALSQRTTEILDPTTLTFTKSGSMVTNRDSHVAVTLSSGKVLVAGGYTGGISSLSELFSAQALGGTCVDAGECGSLFCVEGRCCEKSACASTETCTGASSPGTCTKKNGTACGGNAECASARCVDGVCCDTGCTGQCEACNLTGQSGICSPTPTGAAPVGARTACTGTGACKGTCGGVDRTQCTGFAGSATVCAVATCSGAAESSSAAGCNGAGACGTPTKTDCGGYACNTTSALCRTTCAVNDDCATAAGFGCSGGFCVKGANGATCTGAGGCNSGFCVDATCCAVASCDGLKKCNVAGKRGVCSVPSGGSCVTGGDCGSGLCVDGVCCDSACNGQCEACNVTGKAGLCTLVPSGSDPRAPRAACAGTGTCVGHCDGVSRDACNYPGSSTVCTSASCSGTTETLRAGCDGKGACTPADTKKCEPFVCDTNTCKISCKVDADCVAGTCDVASGQCGVGAKCDGDFTVQTPGKPDQDCRPLRCSGSSCLTTCATSDQCVAGYICDGGRCIQQAAPTSEESGGCSTGRAPATGALFAALAALGLARSRRRRSYGSRRR